METVVKSLIEREARLRRDLSMHTENRNNLTIELDRANEAIGYIEKALRENDEALKILRGTNE